MLSEITIQLIEDVEKFADAILAKTAGIVAFQAERVAFESGRKLLKDTEGLTDDAKVQQTILFTLSFIRKIKEKNINKLNFTNLEFEKPDYKDLEKKIKVYENTVNTNNQTSNNNIVNDHDILKQIKQTYFNPAFDVLLKFEVFADWVFNHSENIAKVLTLRTTYLDARKSMTLSEFERFRACDTFIKGFTSRLCRKNRGLSKLPEKRLKLSDEFINFSSDGDSPLCDAIRERARIDERASEIQRHHFRELIAGIILGLASFVMFGQLNRGSQNESDSSSEEGFYENSYLIFLFMVANAAGLFLYAGHQYFRPDAFHDWVERNTGYEMISDNNDFISTQNFFMAFSYLLLMNPGVYYTDTFNGTDYKSWLYASLGFISIPAGNITGRIVDETRALCCHLFPRTGERRPLLINRADEESRANNRVDKTLDKDPIFGFGQKAFLMKQFN